jgi:hypothetical protein
MLTYKDWVVDVLRLDYGCAGALTLDAVVVFKFDTWQVDDPQVALVSSVRAATTNTFTAHLARLSVLIRLLLRTSGKLTTQR